MPARSSIFALICSIGLLAGTQANAQTKADPWQEYVGKQVTVIGEAHNAESGALLEVESFPPQVPPADAPQCPAASPAHTPY